MIFLEIIVKIKQIFKNQNPKNNLFKLIVELKIKNVAIQLYY